jgi:hypothetical protein
VLVMVFTHPHSLFAHELQMLPQAPQLFLSVATLVQPLAHNVWSALQAGAASWASCKLASALASLASSTSASFEGPTSGAPSDEPLASGPRVVSPARSVTSPMIAWQPTTARATIAAQDALRVTVDSSAFDDALE